MDAPSTRSAHPDALELACRLARKAGTVSATGVYAERIELHMGIVWIKALTLKTGHANVIKHVDPVLELLASGGLDPTPLVTHHMKLDEAAEAYDVYDRREALKIVLTPVSDGATSPGTSSSGSTCGSAGCWRSTSSPRRAGRRGSSRSTSAPRSGRRRSSAQITNYARDELEGSLVVAVVNFPPKQIGPFVSECLVSARSTTSTA